MLVLGATIDSTVDDRPGLPPARRLSSSADGLLGNGRRRKGTNPSPPEVAILVLGNFQGVVVLDMGLVKVGETKCATVRIEAPESARRAVTTVGVDPKQAPFAGLEVNFCGEISLGRGEFHEAQVTWGPENAGKFRGNLAFRVNGRFPAQVSVVGESFEVGGGGGKRRKGDGREGRKRVKVPSVGGVSVGGRRSLSQEASSRDGPYTLKHGKENRLSLSAVGAVSALGRPQESSTSSVLAQGTTNKRQQMLKYSASRRLSLQLPLKRGKSQTTVGESKTALMRKVLDDKGWAEKQAAGFTNWLNFTLVGAEQPRQGEDNDGKDDGDGNQDGEFAGEDGGALSGPLKAMVAMRHEARQRMRAMCLFRSEEICQLTEAVRDRVYEDTISLRRDRVLHADVGLSSTLVDLVLCYEPRWLVMGLETVFGEIVPMPKASSSKGGKPERALRTFVAERLVKCPVIKAKFGFRGRIGSGRSEMEYNDEISRHTLTHFLDLVLFLDRAKTENLLHPCPCLFRKTAEVKSSVGMLKVFCQFLHGEGDFVRHLKKMGYVVAHVQSFIDEFDFRVGNLAVDLRDGVRLMRLVEVVTGEWGLATGLRVPAVSRLQKIFNTRKAIDRLDRDGIVAASAATAVTPKDVVDGDQDATLRLLWAIIARYSLSALLDRDALAREAEGVVSAAKKWRHAGFSPARPERRVVMMSTIEQSDETGARAGVEVGFASPRSSPASPLSPPPPSGGRAVAGKEHPPIELPDIRAVREGWGRKDGSGGIGGSGSDGDDKHLLSALLVWCQAVCHGYGVPIRNFTTSFADGRALCLLLHYYHPRVLSLNAIRRTTAHLPRIGGGGQSDLEDWSASLDIASVTEAECKEALDGERANVSIARRCVEELGGVPSMLAPFDSTNRPEEKTIITVVAHLCSRLLESSAEIRSTILVQRSYRAYLERTGRGDFVERARAAKAKARAKAAADRAKALLRQGLLPPTSPALRRGSSSELQMYVSEKQKANLAAGSIQHWWVRSVVERRRQLRTVTAATLVQAAWRGRAARLVAGEKWTKREENRRMSEAATKIQAAWLGRSERQAFLISKSAAKVVQVWVRARLQRRWYLALQKQISAAVTIQALVRGAAAKRMAESARREQRMKLQASQQREAVTTIQAWCRFRSARAEFMFAKRAAICLQAAARCLAGTNLYRKQRAAIIAIQSLQRGVKARTRLSQEQAKRAQRECVAAVSVQALVRGALLRLAHRRQAAAVVVIQSTVRGNSARFRATERLDRVALLQRWTRGALEARKYGRTLAAVSLLQAFGRGVIVRNRLTDRCDAAVRVQAWARGCLQSRQFCRCLRAIIVLQALRRGVVTRTWVVERQRAAICIQAVARGRIDAISFERKRIAVVSIQAWRRAVVVRGSLAQQQKAAVRLQACARAKAERKRYLETVDATVALQAWWRGAVAAARYRKIVGAVMIIQARWRAAIEMARYRTMVASAQVIQSRWRGALAVARYRKNVNAIVTIQARWRGAVAASHYHVAVSAVVIIQARWRATSEVARYLTAITAAKAIQSRWRGAVAAARYRTQINAIVVIQARWRGTVAASRYHNAVGAVVIIQARWRTASEAACYRSTLAAVKTIQANWRRVAAVSRYRKYLRDVVAIQTWWRSVAASSRYRKAITAAVLIQVCWRRASAEWRYDQAITATVTIQAYWRGMMAVSQYRKTVTATIVIQARWRGASAAWHYRMISIAAVTIQSNWRAKQASREFALQVYRVTKLQAWCRGMLARVLVNKKERSAVKLQSAWRGLVDRTNYMKTMSGVVRLQALARGVQTCARLQRERREAAERKAALRAAAVEQAARQAQAAALVLQVWHRGRMTLQRRLAKEAAATLAATVRMQAAVRGVVARRALKASITAATIVQAYARGRRARVKIARRSAATIKIQSLARVTAALAKAKQMRKKRSEKLAAVGVQSLWRGVAARALLSRRVAAATKIQRLWRSSVEKARLATLRAQEAALLLSASTVLQAHVRGYLSRAIFYRQTVAITAIQACWRGASTRKVAAERIAAMVHIQAFIRAALTAARYRRARAAVVTLQACWRGVSARVRLRAEVEARDAVIREGAAVKLQTLARGVSKRAELEKIVTAVVAVQRAWRKKEARLSNARLVAVVRVQAWWKMSSAVAELARIRRGTIVLQSIVRGCTVRRTVLAESSASSAIGAWWRAARGVRCYRRTLVGVVALQSFARGKRAREDVAARWLALGRRFSKHQAATMIQAAARGMAVRHSAGARMVAIRSRIAQANDRARADPSQILGHKVNDALEALEHGTQLTAIIRACIALELTSRYSKECCQVMAESRCPQVLYDLVRGLNRSPPHQKILKYTIITFRNIVQRGGRLPALVATPPVAVETFVDLLQMYRERPEVFLPTARLLQQLVVVHRPAKNECNLPKHTQRLEGVRDILVRKAAAEAKGAAARGGGSSTRGGRSARSLKAVEHLLGEIARN